MMERLSFVNSGKYDGLEASVHLARYALVRDYCRGRKVLDVACGEGYGSRLMHDWGAKEVVGVDVSEEAVKNAQANFAVANLRYLAGDAERLDELLGNQKFDLIVSLETIEHLYDPITYLKAIAKLRSQDGIVLISCPNDWWYYPNDTEFNPFHIRKYSSDEFLALTKSVLGEPDAFGLGTALAGFVNLPLETISSTPEEAGQLRMMDSSIHHNTYLVPPEADTLSVANCSYFVARWGGERKKSMGAAIFPVPMDIFRNGMYSRGNQDGIPLPYDKETISLLQVKIADLSKQHELSQAEASLQLDNFRSECEHLRMEVADASAKLRAEEISQAEVSLQLEDFRTECEHLRIEVADAKAKLRSEEIRFAAISVENKVVCENARQLQSLNEQLALENDRLTLELKALNDQIVSEHDRLTLEFKAINDHIASENDRLILELQHTRSELEIKSIAAFRYFRIRSLIPHSILNLARKLRNHIKKVRG
jgi:SAM-dependent methyltransferase